MDANAITRNPARLNVIALPLDEAVVVDEPPVAVVGESVGKTPLHPTLPDGLVGASSPGAGRGD